MTKRAVFIGRWTPFHKGHLEIMKKKIEQGIPLLILIRDTPYDVYPPKLRQRMVEAAMQRLKVDAKVEIIDDIESVNYGRGVGYEINEIIPPEHITNISATKIREMISTNDKSWKDFIPEGADKVLEDYLMKKGTVIWFTGRPKAGKTTISELVSKKLEEMGIKAEKIDSNMLRSTISKDLGFSKGDRDKNLERATFITKLLSKNGAVAIASFITPYASERRKIRNEIEENARFIEVYVKASVEACKKRDDEGIYEKAEKGLIEDFTGISQPYEVPENAEITVDTEKLSPEESAEKIVDYIKSLV